jgi:hypothetical protein
LTRHRAAKGDWSALECRAELVFFGGAFADEDDVARQLIDFDILIVMRDFGCLLEVGREL